MSKQSDDYAAGIARLDTLIQGSLERAALAERTSLLWLAMSGEERALARKKWWEQRYERITWVKHPACGPYPERESVAPCCRDYTDSADQE